MIITIDTTKDTLDVKALTNWGLKESKDFVESA